MEEFNYIIDAFTKEGENTNLEVNNLNVGRLKSIDNNFELDSNGNLTINSLTANDMRIANQLISNVMYPVGSIYISASEINPTTYFCGQWEQIKDRFLLGTGDTYDNGITGGNQAHNNMPLYLTVYIWKRIG